MGGRGRRTQRKHFRQNRENVWKRSKTDPQPIDENNQNNGNSGKDPTWIPWDNQSAAFDDYYREQGIVAPEEWDTFVDCLRKPLPAAFRINSSCQFCSDILQQVEDDFVKSLQAEISDGDEAEAIRPLPWYPEKLAWHSNFSRNQLRKNQTLQRFHGFLKQANEIGNITRQEAVSMVPPLFLNVHPDHFVLDMCAAPGSKTFQLLEIIHRSKEVGSLPSGMVVANDVDVQRSNLLIHQTKRMCTANLIVTNHEAQNFPGCQLKNRRNASDVGMANSISLDRLMFDRVLCDVPCSGDGTLRKAPDLWRKWNSGMANGLHSLQLKIAMRGLSLLRVGGRMVYSTCSMNPVENEAVVAEILRRCGESVELVDASSELPQLVRRPGMKKWKVRDKGGWLASYKDVPDNRRSAVTPSMFPSGGNLGLIEDDDDHESNEINSDSSNVGSGSVLQITNIDPVPSSQVACEEVSILPLEHCMRIVPHDQNTGAFFIAVFHKHSNIPVGPDRINGLDVDTQDKNGDLPEVALNEATQSEITSDTNPVDDTKNPMSEPTPDADFVEEKLDVGAIGKQTSQVSAESKVDVCEDVAQKAGTKRKLQMQGRWKGVDPVLLFKDETIIDRIKKYYGIDDSFPFSGHLVSRNSDNNHVKRIYYISKSVKDVLDLNFQVGHPLKIASVGLKMFERQTSREGNSSPCSFRISSEGLPLLLPYITKQILYASPTDFKHLLQYRSIKFADFVDAEFGEKASNLMMGCCVVVLRGADCDSAEPIRITSSTIAVGCWKGNHNLAVMASAIDCKDLLEWVMKRMGIEDVPMQESKPSATHEPIGTEDVGAMLDSEPSATHEPIGMEDAAPVPDSEPSATHEPIGMEDAASVPDNEPFSTPTVVDKSGTE